MCTLPVESYNNGKGFLKKEDLWLKNTLKGSNRACHETSEGNSRKRNQNTSGRYSLDLLFVIKREMLNR